MFLHGQHVFLDRTDVRIHLLQGAIQLAHVILEFMLLLYHLALMPAQMIQLHHDENQDQHFQDISEMHLSPPCNTPPRRAVVEWFAVVISRQGQRI